MFNVAIPQASSLSTWYTGIVSVPLTAGAQFVLDNVNPILLAQKSAMLYRLDEAYFSYNVGSENFDSGFVVANPAKLQLGTNSSRGEFLLANPLLLGGSHPFTLNAWRRAKNDDEPIYIIPFGQVDGSGNGFVGCSTLEIVCRFLVTSINDRDFQANFETGCV
jgi:hypothetical protein